MRQTYIKSLIINSAFEKALKTLKISMNKIAQKGNHHPKKCHYKYRRCLVFWYVYRLYSSIDPIYEAVSFGNKPYERETFIREKAGEKHFVRHFRKWKFPFLKITFFQY